MPALTPERVKDLRAFVEAGGRLDAETAKAVVENMRYGRISVEAYKPAAKGKKATKKVMTDDELFADLDHYLGAGSEAGDGADGDGADEPDSV